MRHDLSIHDLHWSPDGERVVFACQDFSLSDAGIFGVCMVDADGSNVRRVLTDREDVWIGSVRWSPDADTISFTRATDSHGLYVMSATGRRVRRLTELGGLPRHAWSPDGSKIAYLACRRVMVIDVETRRPAVVRRIRHRCRAGDITWSPDGTKLLYWNGGRSLRAMNADGTHDTALIRLPDATSNGFDWQPQYDG